MKLVHSFCILKYGCHFHLEYVCEILVFRSPSIMGIVVADRRFFGEIGSLDGGMKIYGGENVELGIRVRFTG